MYNVFVYPEDGLQWPAVSWYGNFFRAAWPKLPTQTAE